MPRNRLTLAILAFVLVAAACGGGDDSAPSGSGDDTLSETFTTSDAGQEGLPEVSSEADATTTEGEQMGSAAPDSASGDDPLDSTSDTEPQDSSQPGASSQPVVLLGDRFEWCSDMEAEWTNREQTVSNFLASEAGYEEVLAAYESATDELDRAEIRETLNEAERRYNESHDKFQQALAGAAHQLRRARRTYGDRPEDIAVQRAWAALLSADPELAALSAAVPDDPDPMVAVPVPPRRLTPVEILAELQDDTPRLLNGAAQGAAREVYSQADRALIAEVLATTAVEIAQIVNEAAAADMSGEERGVYFAEDLSNASHILHYLAGSVLEPFDAAAYGAARAADPNASTMVIDSPDAYVRSITHDSVYVEYRMMSEDIIDGDPTYYRYLIGEWPTSDDIALATYAERVQAVYDALPVALESAREATAALQAAEQAEWTRQRDAEQALQAALEELATGSDAYTTFKRSFEESCQ